MKRLRKIFIVMILLLGICISTIAQADGIKMYYEDVVGVVQGGKFFPNTQLPGGYTWFCIQPGGHFGKDGMLTKNENALYPVNSYIPKSGEFVCVECDPNLERRFPWLPGTKHYFRYEEGEKFSFFEHPDAAYVLAEMEEQGGVINWETAYGIWNSSISSPNRSGGYAIEAESQAYKDFYELIHGGLTASDQFESLITCSGGDFSKGVMQSDGSYVLKGPKIDYPDGSYNGENKFSWIESIEAITDAGNIEAEIILSGGEKISLSDLQENGTKTLAGKDFDVRFYSTEATNVTLKIEFGYLEHCEAEMTQYTGKKVYRNFKFEKGPAHIHKEEFTDAITGLPGEIRIPYATRRYKIIDEDGDPTQILMAYAGGAKKVRKTVTKYFEFGLGGVLSAPPPKTPLSPGDTPPPETPGDLTMELAGTVFLDQDTGKINEGNNVLDSGEGLPGTEVYLHEVDKGVVAKTLTDSNGQYHFYNLNSQKKYFVEFVYNGMLYTNVERLPGNATNISKATEEAQGHAGNRQSFNNQFKEIGSNPHNYTSPSRGAYNQVFLQEQIADTFKAIANNYGGHGNSDEEVFAYDCRIHAYSTEVYPLFDAFTPANGSANIGGNNFNALYSGEYDQTHINLGVKARPTFDLALYKDVMKATLNINGQEEVYTYDARKDWNNQGFSYGVREDYYLNELRNKYILNKGTNIKTTETINEGQYSHEYRTEEIINGNNMNENYKSWLQDDEKYKMTLYGDDSNKNYAWRDINSQLNDSEKLQIHVTYKIAIRNQSSVEGSVTEIVDYFDENYAFESAYVGDKDGNPIAGTNVEASQTSIYGEETRMGANGRWTVDGGSRGYKTIYLRPTEKRLNPRDKEQYIYVTFGLINPEETLIRAGLPSGKTFYTYNLAEINGYKTYGVELGQTESLGLIDRDSNPGNFNPGTYTMGVTPLEDDTSKAPAYAYNIRTSRTIEGRVFEDANTGTATSKEHVVDVAKTRFGSGTLDDKDKGIAGVKVELVEIKNGALSVRSTTYTDENGWYGFGAFVPGDYTIRYTYGADDQTTLTKESQYIENYVTDYNEQFKTQNGKTFEERFALSYGIKNDTSYNGQDYQSTVYETAQGQSVLPHNYKVDSNLKNMYEANNKAKNGEEQALSVLDQIIMKYEAENYYWFDDPMMGGRSDATDDDARRAQVTAYAKSEYGKEIINHKAEVFNSYINHKALRQKESNAVNFDEYTQAQPMEEAQDTIQNNRELVNEFERRNYMYAYTPEINVEIEYTTKQIGGNLNQTKGPNDPKDYYEYKIRGVDFGVVERPRSGLALDQDVAHVKVIATDGTTLVELNNNDGKLEVVVDNGNNYQWIKAGKVSQYDRDELINVILDDELLSGAKLEVTYNITITNNSEKDANTTTRAKTIMNYVANNLNFDLNDNNGLWEVMKKEDIQTQSHSTWVNNEMGRNNARQIDLSTQTTVLKATEANPLTKHLKPGESVTSTLTLKKTLSAESAADDLSYTNLSEIVEIDNTVGRYDRGAVPGNQSLEEQPREHDTSGSSRYDEIDEHAGTKNVKTRYPQDGTIIITPPTGETHIYYVLGTIVGAILLVGILIIRKLVVAKNKAKED